MTKFKRKKLKRKFLKFSGAVVISALLSLCTAGNVFAWQFGSGTSLDPYQIWDINDLQRLADTVNNFTIYHPQGNNLHFKLMADITDSVDFSIGSTSGGDRVWNNVFDGNGHKITLAMRSAPALFRRADNQSVIKNLSVDGIVNPNLSASSGAGIVWHNRGIILNCTNYASISASGAGGIAYENWFVNPLQHTNGQIINCHNYGDIHNDGDIFNLGQLVAGGIAGRSVGWVIGCLNAGNIKSLNKYSDYTAGIIGVTDGSDNNSPAEIIVSNNQNTGKVEGFYSVGGIAGRLSSNMNAPVICSNNINYGFVSGFLGVGGIVGIMPFFNTVTLFNNFNSGVVSGTVNVGCIVGVKNAVIIINNHYDKQMCGEED